MPSTLEMIDKKTGMLPASEVVDSEITKIVVQLAIMAAMLPEERKREAQLFEEMRRDLFELRGYLNTHFEYKS